MTFSEKLKQAMQELHLNQRQVCGMTGKSKGSVSQYLSGKQIPSEDVQSAIAVALGLEADYFSKSDEKVVVLPTKEVRNGVIPRLDVEDAAKLLQMNHNTVSRLRNYYTSAQIDVKTNRIEQSVSEKLNSSEFGTKLTQSSTYIRMAWNNCSRYIQFEGSELNIYDTSNSKLMSLTYDGCWYYYKGNKLGKIGTNSWSGDDTFRGLLFQLNYGGDYMGWGHQTSSGSNYQMYLVYYANNRTGIGYHLRKANYYVSEKPRAGFRLHPAFYDVNGHEIDYFLTSAYEGSIWDVDGGEDGTGAYLIKDEQVMNLATDKFCSIAVVKPASGQQQVLTRPNIEALAKNRGANWHGDLIKQVSAEQLLMIIEMGMMNLQTAIAQGIVSIPDNGAYNCASNTGSTFDIGNGTGQAAETTNVKGDVATIETANGKTAICYRGKENFWGNIWKFVYGINIWGNGKMGGGQPYICKDFNFMESKNADNYVGAGFTITNKFGYISAMGYSTSCDWLFIASETDGNSSLPVGDYHWITANLNGYRIALLGGRWDSGAGAGAFCWTLYSGVGARGRTIGGRLVYIPTRDSAEYTAAITSWKEQMKKV